MRIPLYIAVSGKAYPCRILRKYETFADIQLVAEEDDSYFVKVPIGKQKHKWKLIAYVVGA